MNLPLLKALERLSTIHCPSGDAVDDVVTAYRRAYPPETAIIPDIDKALSFRYAQPTCAHFSEGMAEELGESLVVGFSYTLSPGQRIYLRERYGMTPSQTVTLTYLERWSGTESPKAITLRSNQHIDPRNRRHVLTQVVITKVGEFFQRSKELTEEARLAAAVRAKFAAINKAKLKVNGKLKSVKVNGRPKPTKVVGPSAYDLLAELESASNNKQNNQNKV